MKNNINNSIIKIISKHLKVKPSLINDKSMAKDFLNWDSLNNIKIFLSLQKLNTSIKISEYTKCKKVGEIFKLYEIKKI